MLMKLWRIPVFFIVFIAHDLVPSNERIAITDFQIPEEQKPFIYGGLTWSSDSSMIAVGTSGGVWLHEADDLSTKKLLTTDLVITAVDWHPSDDRLAVGDTGGLIQLWDTVTGEQLVEINAHENAVTSIKWSPDGLLLASGSLDNTIQILDADTGESVQVISIPATYIEYSVTWSADSQKIAVKEPGQISIWSIETVERLLSWPLNFETPAVKWSPDGAWIATGSLGGEVRLWDVASGELLYTLDGDRYAVASIAWSPESTMLATQGSISGDGMLRIWNAQTGDLIIEIKGASLGGDSYLASALAWSPNGEQLAAASDDGKIYLWDTETFETVDIYEGYRPIYPSSS